jgi:hypothetical protein
LALSGEWSEIGSYWENGFQNEIDIVALNHLTKKALLVEVKMNALKYSHKVLQEKGTHLQGHLKGFDVELKGMSLGEV